MVRRPVLHLREQQLISTEYQECKAFWHYCQVVLRLGKKIIKICNERKDPDSWYTRSLINIGLTAGVPDYLYVEPKGRFGALWLEMKRRDQRGKKMPASQEEFIALVTSLGHYATFVYGCDDAAKVLNLYMDCKL